MFSVVINCTRRCLIQGYKLSRRTRMFGIGIGGVNLERMVWREDGEKNTVPVGEKK